ncbi:MAG: ferredoxin [Candidatus Rokuibacteriota bacterium]|nr:MAG: ferredoxin [Candidatus Rokubacteria bacterium]
MLTQTGMSEPRLPPAKDLRGAFLACLRAHEACEEAVTHALRAGEPGDECIGALLDCADVCRTTSRYIRHGSPLVRGTASVCAELCERAVESCTALGKDGVLTACVEACRRAAAWCRRLAEMPLERTA